MFDRVPDLGPVRTGLTRAAMHWTRAAYEVVAGVGALLEEVVTIVRDDDEAGPDEGGPTKIEVE
jgi:hypothetical protein